MERVNVGLVVLSESEFRIKTGEQYVEIINRCMNIKYASSDDLFIEQSITSMCNKIKFFQQAYSKNMGRIEKYVELIGKCGNDILLTPLRSCVCNSDKEFDDMFNDLVM